jgi:predicted MFS family arabinose efflux permease
MVQAMAPKLSNLKNDKPPTGRHAALWAALLAITPALIALAIMFNVSVAWSLLGGLMVFGGLFAINSSLHSYLIVSFASDDGVSLDVGFYYMANALGRLLGTVLSGWMFQVYGFIACLWVSAAFICIACVIALFLPRHHAD